ncbi:MAG: cytochrome c peroxidase [Myxococcota bacterium]
MYPLLTLVFACAETPPPPPPAPEPAAAPAPPPAPKHAALFAPLPADMFGGTPASKELVDLGRMLYYDTRMSKGQDISCNSCHLLDKYGVDNLPTSPGHKGQLGGRNSPTSYNAALQFVQFWDGRAATVEEQAKGPVLNPVEMAMPDDAAVMAVLKSIPGYEAPFKAAFPAEPDPFTYDNVAKAIGAFERGLVTKNSKFDKYLAGDAAALSADEAAGLDLYVTTGCTACHGGALLGGSMYQKLGVVKPYETADNGRMDVTKNEADKLMFKVPQLRNITKTAPYYHDGSVATLEEAVKTMADYQLGKQLTDDEVKKIVAFLDTLTGELPTEYVAAPALPESGPKTPKPNKG